MRVMRAAIAAALLATVLTAPAQAQVPPATVTAVGIQFVPPVAVVQGSAPVTFRNAEPIDITHNVFWQVYTPPGGSPQVSAAGFRLCANFAPGQSCVLNTPASPLARGTYAFTCTVFESHTAAMHGLLVVV